MTGRPAVVAAVAVAAVLAAALTGACGRGNDTSVGTLPSSALSSSALPSGAQTASTQPSGMPGTTQTPTKSPPPPGFVDLSDVDPTILLDIRYHTEHNFVGRRIDGYDAPRCLLTAKAAEALRRVQQAAKAKGYSLKMYDCYRPQRAGEDFRSWAAMPNAQEMKAEFYPSLSKSDLLGGWISGGRGSHSRGSTVDLTLVALPPSAQRPYVPGETLVSCTAPAGRRFPDNTIDMGTGYDCFDLKSRTEDTTVPAQAAQNRQILKQLMVKEKFSNYVNEWWHYRLEGEPFPDEYFDFPISP